MIKQMMNYSNKIKTMVEGIKKNLGEGERNKEKKEMRDFYYQQMDPGPKEELPSDTDQTEVAAVDRVFQMDAKSVVVA